MIKLFKLAKPFVIPLLAVYTILLNLNLFLKPPTVDFYASAPLSQLFYQGLSQVSNPSITLVVIFVVLLLLQAFLLNFIVDRHKIITTSTSLPAFAYILLMSLFNEYIFLSPPFLANFALLLALDRVYVIYTEDSYSKLFDIGFAIGIASLFFLPNFVMIFFLLTALSIVRIFNWREWTTSMMGVFIPYFLLGTYYLFTNELDTFLQTHFLSVTSSIVPTTASFIEVISKAGVMLLVALFGAYFFQAQFLKTVVKLRKFLTILVYLLAVSILIFLFIGKFSLAPAAIISIPLAVFLGYSFYQLENERLSELIHIVMLCPLFFFQYTSIF